MSFAAKLHVLTDPRRSDRRAADIDGTLRGRRGVPIDVRVIDISRHGFRCTTTADLREGDAVAIGLRGNADGSALIRWRRGAQIGCEFAQPLSEAAVHAALSADVVVSVAQWAKHAPASRRTSGVIETTSRPARLFATLLTAALLVDLADNYLRRLI